MIQYLLRQFIKLVRFVFLIPVYVYKKLISPLLGPNCRYHPSCSTYFIGAVKQNGMIKGSILGFARISRCNGLFCGGIDNPPRRIKWKLLVPYLQLKHKNFRDKSV